MPRNDLIVAYERGLSVGVHPKNRAASVATSLVRVVERNLGFAAQVSRAPVILAWLQLALIRRGHVGPPSSTLSLSAAKVG